MYKHSVCVCVCAAACVSSLYWAYIYKMKEISGTAYPSILETIKKLRKDETTENSKTFWLCVFKKIETTPNLIYREFILQISFLFLSCFGIYILSSCDVLFLTSIHTHIKKFRIRKEGIGIPFPLRFALCWDPEFLMKSWLCSVEFSKATRWNCKLFRQKKEKTTKLFSSLPRKILLSPQ